MSDVINEKEKLVLGVLATAYNDEANCFYFKGIAENTGLEIKEIRRACRSLAKKGFAKYERGLFDDGGMVAGSGYGCTEEGSNLADKLEIISPNVEQ